MSARVDRDWVISVLGPNYSKKKPDLEPSIRWANLLVNRVAACAIKKSSPLTDDELKEIEGLLAAHRYQHQDKGLTSRSALGVSGSFEGQFGKYLESSNYGMSAVLLDPSGCLQEIAQGGAPGAKDAGGVWLGKPPSERLTIDEQQ